MATEEARTDTVAPLDEKLLASPRKRTQQRTGPRLARRHQSVNESLRGLGGRVGPGGSSFGRREGQVAFVLKEDPDLAESLCDRDRRIAEEVFQAPVVILDEPRWEPQEFGGRAYGLLLLEGLLGRRVRVGRAVATELLGPGDIVRPWEEPCQFDVVPPDVSWRVFSRTRTALLDERITRLMGRWPELVVAFSDRLLRRARYAEYVRTASHLRRVEDRLLATLWHLASNWGRVTPRGVRVPFPLTHELLGEIVGAQRPSVTTAIQRLQERNELVRDLAGGYLLTARPHAEKLAGV
jgi:CRP/FNR family transcriptional regulator, cyclic AMP receptor protein